MEKERTQCEGGYMPYVICRTYSAGVLAGYPVVDMKVTLVD